MSKCHICNSCLRIMSVSGVKYWVCRLCKTVYDLEYNIVMDKYIIEEIGKQRGWKLE